MKAVLLGARHAIIIASVLGPMMAVISANLVTNPLVGIGLLLFFGYPTYIATSIVQKALREEKLKHFAKWHEEEAR